MRRVRVLRRQQLVEAMLGKVRRVGNVETEVPQARCADKDQECGDRLDAARNVAEAVANQIGARKGIIDFHVKEFSSAKSGGVAAALHI